MPSGAAVSKRNERVGVIKKLNEELIVSLEMRVILGGDFNMTEGPKDIRNIRQKSLMYREDVIKFKACRRDNNLTDIYRTQNPEGRIFTRVGPSNSARIDKIYVRPNNQKWSSVIYRPSTQTIAYHLRWS